MLNIFKNSLTCLSYDYRIKEFNISYKFKMNIYIKVEVRDREFLSRFLLGATSALKGNDVLIGDDEVLELVEKKSLTPV